MSEYSVIPLADILDEIGESDTEKLLSSFSCPKNTDVENFLRQPSKAISMEKQRVSVTYLVFCQSGELNAFCGYFTLASKVIAVEKGNGINAKTFDRIRKFGACDSNICTIPSPLIAQLGKNYTNGSNRLIDGDTLLGTACLYVKEAQRLIGGKVVYIECEDKPKLTDFYGRNGFVEFDRRELDADERDDGTDSRYLLRMLKYLE